MRFSKKIARFVAAASLCFVPAAVAFAQEDEEAEFEIEDRVEIHISGSHWQSCEVTENDSALSYMRVKCKAYKTPRMSRAAGVYMVSRSPSDVRRDKKAQQLPEGAYKDPEADAPQ